MFLILCVGLPLGVARRLAQALIRLVAPAARAEGTWGHFMGRTRHGVPLAVLFLLALLCEACGGSTSSLPPPPPAADFTLNFSSNSISIAQGAASSAVTFSVNPLNGFSLAVPLALHPLPPPLPSTP